MAQAGLAVVVGAGPGLGASVARKFAAGGLKVAVVARNIETVAPLAKQITDAGGHAAAFASDATDAASVASTYDKIKAELGPATVLVYNAGAGKWPPPPFEEAKLADFKLSLETSAVGAFIWAQAVLPSLKEAKSGTMLFTGATASLRGGARFAGFAPGKFALRGLAQSLARELQPQNIHVAHIIIDGGIDSERVRNMRGQQEKADTLLSPDAIADTYWFLHTQHRSAWAHEVDLRPWAEKF